jgi:hypothetical protein
LYQTTAHSKIKLCAVVGNKPCTRNLQGKCITFGIENIGPQNSHVSRLQESTMLKKLEGYTHVESLANKQNSLVLTNEENIR